MTAQGDSVAGVVSFFETANGKIMQLSGGTDLNDQLLLRYPFPDYPAAIWIEFEAMPEFVSDAYDFRVMKANFDNPNQPYRSVEVGYWDNRVRAYDFGSGSWKSCASKAGGQWHHVQIRIAFFLGTFDVWVDGWESQVCKGLLQDNNTLARPYVFFEVLDWSTAGRGGNVWFDNFTGREPQSPP
ncbi:MAG: hypothetical protein M5R36_17290 [Deltaproteobacteria bacterium]|nr:hypothetical protein [Deltaproteobacteria bacterium]